MPICQAFYRHYLYNIFMVTLHIIKQRLREAIKQSGLTQKEIADRLNVRQPTVNNYISGRALPALDTFANICVVLDADPAYLLGLNDGV